MQGSLLTTPIGAVLRRRRRRRRRSVFRMNANSRADVKHDAPGIAARGPW
jgi:hypothetical protein